MKKERIKRDNEEKSKLLRVVVRVKYTLPRAGALMQSAIAARKARQQNLPDPNTSTKRRRSHHSKARKRSRSEKKHDSGTSLTSQKEVVLLGRSDDDSGMSIDLDQEDVTLPQPEQSKAWSPSRLVFYSSDGASDANETPPRFPSYNNRPTNEEPEILSTYQPSPDQNMFQLSSDEGSSLGLNGPAIVLVLFPSATMSLVGTYRLRVLRGSVSLLGTIVQPSQVVHQVFAPYSSPIPVILGLEARGESSKSLSCIPARILSTANEGDVVIVLQELKTGVDGLGCVVRTFEGVFDDAHPKGIPALPLQGVNFVSCSFLENSFLFYKGPPDLPSRTRSADLPVITILGSRSLQVTIFFGNRDSRPFQTASPSGKRAEKFGEEHICAYTCQQANFPVRDLQLQ